MGDEHDRRVKRVAWGIGLLTLAVYLRVGGHAFLTFDDPVYVTDNAHVQRGLAADGIRWAFTATEGSNYWHPLTWMSHMLDVDLFGLRAGAHHLSSAVLHAISAALLFLVLRGMTGALWRSALVAALFGVHPLHVESVAWVAERKDVLSGLFWVLTLGAYARFARGSVQCSVFSAQGSDAEPKAQNAERKTGNAVRWYLATLGLFVCGLMSKPMVVTLPFVLLLLDWWPLKRVPAFANLLRQGYAGQEATAGKQGSGFRVRGLLVEKIPFFVLSAVVVWWAYRTQAAGGVLQSGEVVALPYRVANAALSYWAYLRQMVWPVDLAFYYPHPQQAVSMAQAVWAMAGLAGVTVAALLLARRWPYVGVGWFWYAGTLLPVIGLIQIGDFARADRYMYLPLTGIFLIVVWGATDVIGHGALVSGKGRRCVAGVLGGAVVLACAVMTWRQTGFWKDGIVLARHALRVTGDSAMAYNCLGQELLMAGRTEESVAMFRKALTLRGPAAHAHYNTGLALLNLQRLDEAMTHFEAALRLEPTTRKAHYNLGVFLAMQQRYPEAVDHYRAELEVNPGYAMALSNLGYALAQTGDLQGAREACEAAVKSDPMLAEGHLNLGALLDEEGRTVEAIAEYEAVLRLSPTMIAARIALASALAMRGDLDAARAQYAEVLRQDPSRDDVRRELEALGSDGEGIHHGDTEARRGNF